MSPFCSEMQPQHSSRIDLNEIKTQIVKKIGIERSKKYFCDLNRFLSQKLSKSEFDKSCCRLLGRENVALHNQLIRSILNNACRAKTPPPIYKACAKSPSVSSTCVASSRETGQEQNGPAIQNQAQKMPILSNGFFAASPRKVRSGNRERKLKDRPSPLGPNGKIEVFCHKSTILEDNNSTRASMENGELPLPATTLHRQHDDDDDEEATRSPKAARKDHNATSPHDLGLSRNLLLPPLGIRFCSSLLDEPHKSLLLHPPPPLPPPPPPPPPPLPPLLPTSSRDLVSYYDGGELCTTEMLRKRMECIAQLQGLGAVSMESANMLNNTLDVYLKRLIRNCVEHKHLVQKQQISDVGAHHGSLWPSNSDSVTALEERKQSCYMSLLDFKASMEANPQQLGEHWPLLMEKICMTYAGE